MTKKVRLSNEHKQVEERGFEVRKLNHKSKYSKGIKLLSSEKPIPVTKLENIKVTKLENIQLSKFAHAENRWKNAINVWETAKNPIGYSIHKLSELTGINDREVKEIIQRLQNEGLIKEKNRGTFKGWVSVEDERIYELDI